MTTMQLSSTLPSLDLLTFNADQAVSNFIRSEGPTRPMSEVDKRHARAPYGVVGLYLAELKAWPARPDLLILICDRDTRECLRHSDVQDRVKSEVAVTFFENLRFVISQRCSLFSQAASLCSEGTLQQLETMVNAIHESLLSCRDLAQQRTSTNGEALAGITDLVDFYKQQSGSSDLDEAARGFCSRIGAALEKISTLHRMPGN